MMMNLSNASTFLLTGIAMSVLPVIAPALCPANGFDGTSARELWLQVMGFINAAIGTGYLARAGWEGLATTWATQAGWRTQVQVPAQDHPHPLARNGISTAWGR